MNAAAESVILQPQPGPQWEFLATPADIAIYGGAAGGGKSYALLLDVATWVQEPNYTAVLFRRLHNQHFNAGGLWSEAESLFPLLGGTANEAKYEWEWPHPEGPAVIQFRHLQHEKTKLAWQGAQLAFIGFDELTHFSETQFLYLTSRMRSKCRVRPYLRATTNPDPDSWVRQMIDWYIGADGFPIPQRSGVLRWFVRGSDGKLAWADSPEELRQRYPKRTPQSFTFIPALLSDNPALTKRDPDYQARLENLSPADAAALLGGNWNARAAGQAFDGPTMLRIQSTEPVTWGVHLLAFDAGGRRNPAGLVVLRVASADDGTVRTSVVYSDHWWGPITHLLDEVARVWSTYRCVAMACDSYDDLLVGQARARFGSDAVHVKRGGDENLFRWYESLLGLAQAGAFHVGSEHRTLLQDLRRARVDGRLLVMPEYEPPERDSTTPADARIHCDALDALLRLVPVLGEWTGAQRPPDDMPMPWESRGDDEDEE